MVRASSWNRILATALAFAGASGFTSTASTSGEEPTVSAAPTAAPVATTLHDASGICTFVDTVQGTEKEEGQDRLSVQTKDEVRVTRDNKPNYVRMLTIFGTAKTEFYFSPPPAVVDGTAWGIAVEVTALVPTPGSGGVWDLSLNSNSDGNDTLTTIGNFAEADNVNWTTVYLTVPLAADSTGSLDHYLSDNNEMLLTVTTDQPDTTQVIFIDFMEIKAVCGGEFAPATLTASPTGMCTFVDTVIGVEKEEGQDRLSVQARDGVPVAFENIVNYVRLLTVFGVGQTDFYFSPPAAIVDGTAKEITVEVSALVPTAGSGSVWNVGLSSNVGGNDMLTTIGNLAAVGDVEWTTVTLAMSLDGVDVSSYVNANNELLLTVSCSELGSTQVIFIDFIEVTASDSTNDNQRSRALRSGR